MAGDDLAQLSLEKVAAACRAEAEQPRQHERGACFELFRRALEAGDAQAWAAVAAQYQLLILRWVYAARRTAELGDPQELAHEALERFWRTLSGRCNPLTARFPHVGALLRYLQQCALTTALDARRRDERAVRLAKRTRHVATLASSSAPGPEEAALARIEREQLTARARAWVAAAVADPGEQLVLRLSYNDELSPVEIAARHPELFSDAAAVRQIKERILRRARRALIDGGNDADPALSD